MAKYKVTLLYPAHMNDSGTETYGAIVEADSHSEAEGLARTEAQEANTYKGEAIIQGCEFELLDVELDRTEMLREALKRMVDECGGCPPDFLKDAHAEALRALKETA
jgi:hypothetical protein